MSSEVKFPTNRLVAGLQHQEGLRAKSYKIAQVKRNRKKAMKPSIDFNECLKDSPKFRASVEENEQSIYDLETHLEKVSKACSSFVECGKVFRSSMGSLIHEFEGLSSLFKDDLFVNGAVTKICSNLSDIKNFFGILLDQAQRSIGSKLHSFLKDEIKKFKETKKHFDKISDELDSVFAKNSQLPKTCKVSEAEEVDNLLLATESAFNHTSLDYAFQINILQSKRRFHILGQILTFMHAHTAFFKQGGELVVCLEPYLKELGSRLDHMQYEFNCEQKEMEERHTLVQRKNEMNQETRNSLSNRNGRRWFTIQDNKIYYQKRSKDSQTELVDVRLCTVKRTDDVERRFAFALVSPTKCWYLQADNDQVRRDWIEAVQVAIAKALNDPQYDEDSSSFDKSMDPLEKLHPHLLEQIRSLPGNDVCADCDSPNPKWASINIGITLCIECSGIHRSLGVHISKVRSITLDDWEPESIKLMSELGNRVINDIYEANEDDSMKKPNVSSSRAEREEWIKAKYVEKRFVSKIRPRRTSAAVKRFRRKQPIKKFPDGKIRRWSAKKSDVEAAEILLHLSADREENHSPKMDEEENSKQKMAEDSNGEGCPVVEGGSPRKKDGSTQESNISPEATDGSPGLRAGSPEAEIGSPGSDVDNNRSVNADMNSPSSFDGGSPATPHLRRLYDSRGTDSATSSDECETEEEMRSLPPNQLLYQAAKLKNMTLMILALSNGANVNWSNPDHAGMTPLHQSVAGGSVSVSEFLLQNGAKINAKDDGGRSCLHQAALLGSTGHACLFLKRGANQSSIDEHGEDALRIALKYYHADIVTLLRLARMNEELRETEVNTSPDETFSNVIKDFSNMASQHPERLKRGTERHTSV
eukprot:gene7081-12721_t